MRRMSKKMQLKNVWENRLKYKKDRGRQRKNWNEVIARIIVSKGKPVNQGEIEARERKSTEFCPLKKWYKHSINLHSITNLKSAGS